MRNKGLFILYNKAGTDFLAFKMEKIFTKITTPEEQALHNDMLADILGILEGKETIFFKDMADFILYPKVNKRKRFLFRLAERILHIGQSNS